MFDDDIRKEFRCRGEPQLADGMRRRNLDLRMFLHARMNSKKI